MGSLKYENMKAVSRCIKKVKEKILLTQIFAAFDLKIDCRQHVH